MIFDLLFIVLGLVGLYYGADFLVKGSARLAASFGIPTIVIGLTVVSYGTSMPEQIVSLTAAFNGTPDVAVGNVVGSNIFNIALILGLTAFVFPVHVHPQLIRRDIPLMIAVSVLAYLMAFDGRYSRVDGAILFAGILSFTFFSYYSAMHKGQAEPEEEAPSEPDEVAELLSEQTNPLLEAGRALLGVAILMVAARLTVDGATSIASAIGISDAVIGLTLVAAGTSLPELATSFVAALRKQADIAIGNVVGSNIFNLLSILGLTSMVAEIKVADEFLRYDFPVMIAIAVLLYPLAFNKVLSKLEGAFFLAVYVGYTVFLFVR
jgi:cation:H+ antiporter